MVVDLTSLYNALRNTYQSIKDFFTTTDKIYRDPTPQDVHIQMLDENGNLVTKTIPNMAKWRNTIWQDAQQAMAKTVYVDQQNGDDNTGDGSQDRPFKSLQKAIDSVPPGGRVKIVLLNDYDLANDSQSTLIVSKSVTIDTNNFTLKKTNTTNRFVIVEGVSYLHFYYGTKIILDNSSLDSPNYKKALIHIEANGIGFIDIGWDSLPERQCDIQMDSHLIVATRSIGFLNAKGTNFSAINNASGLYVIANVDGGHVEGYGSANTGIDGSKIVALSGTLTSY